MTDKKFKLSFTAKHIDREKFSEDELNSHFKIEDSFDLNADRSESLKHDVDFDDQKIIQLTTSDGLEWIGYADDIPEINGEKPASQRSDGSETYHLTPNLKVRGHASRSAKDTIRNAVLDVIVGKASDLTARAAARLVDNKKCQNPGLHGVNKKRNTVKVDNISENSKILIFVHGTISSFEDGFNNIDSDQWEELWNEYKGQVYAFNHKTISESPFENAAELLKLLPVSANIDMISHSRGGLISDVLARCDFRNELIGFDSDDIEIIRKDFDDQKDGENILKAIDELNIQAQIKKISVDKIVRVACPAFGTTLLSDRMDHFLNAILNLIGKAVGGRLNPIYQYVKLFLLKVVEEKSDPGSFPGLWSMVPDSAFQKVNNKEIELSSSLYSIAGDSDIGGGFWHSLKVIISNLYYWGKNDFVVNTDSMIKGVVKRKSNYYAVIENKTVQHFNYFSIESHMNLVLTALTNEQQVQLGWTQIKEDSTDRGIALKLIDLGELKPKLESGNNPIVVLVPGIMGSHIYHEGDLKWLDFHALYKGALVNKLGVDKYDSTSAGAVVDKYYGELANYLARNNHDVVVHPFDWRRSLSECVDEFDKIIERVSKHGKPVRIVSHSMGGLLVKQWKIDKKNKWESFRNRSESRWIMLGTPWNGSHLITEVLTGQSKRVKQLNILDFKHTKREILDSLVFHKGIFDLLPVSDSRIDKIGEWKNLAEAAGKKHMAPIPQSQFQYYQKFKKKVTSPINGKISADDQDYVFYVAGKHRKTIDDYQIKKSFFKGKHVKFYHTDQGDGSVTWATGIPEGLKTDNLYYVKVEHGDLAGEPDTFDGIRELIERGRTASSAFSKNKIRSAVSRGARGQVLEPRELPLHLASPEDNIFGIDRYKEDEKTEKQLIEVEVFNGDLKWSKYPIMVGHFVQDGIVNAERAIDLYFDNKLSERHQMGFYPGKIGEQDIIFDPKSSPKGTVIIGLGDKDELTGYNLSKSVERAMLKYAVFFRDNMLQEQDELISSVSTLIIGSNYGQLPMKESIRSILMGIQNANSIISEIESLKPITKVEFVDYYEDNAYECFKVLQDIDEEEENSINIILKDKISVGYRNKKRLLREDSNSWWQSFTTELKEDQSKQEYLAFGTYNRQATASQEPVYVNLELARYVANELSSVQEWDRDNSKVIFEMLLPNRYKDFIRNHRNIEWRMDLEAATFPWEMFHDFTFGEKPTFIESGLIRQLYSPSSNIRPALVRQQTALVIANPKFKEGGLPQLDGAETEGMLVAEMLNKNEYVVDSKINSQPMDIIKSLFSGEFKVLHVASHGLYDKENGKENGKVGIAIGDGQLLTPGTLKQMTSIPEFVFVNCCFSGKTKPKDEAYTRNRNRLAANIGTQLIEMGVKAVVVAGWAVHDEAAKIFAKVLYRELLKGVAFGDAVTAARRACYEAYPKYNTWGAYQCYGDQFYRLNLSRRGESADQLPTLQQEIVIELDNLLSSAQSVELSRDNRINVQKITRKMKFLTERAEILGIVNTEIIEREALILTYLGKYKQAVVKYRELFAQDDAGFMANFLDTYCNIRAKNLVNCRFGHCEITKDNIEKVISDMEQIPLIERGPRRLYTIGSTYKRAAIIAAPDENSKDKKSKIKKMKEYLEKSAHYYLNSGKLVGMEERSAIYQITTFISVSLFCNNGKIKDRIDISDELEKSPRTYLKEWIEKVNDENSDRSDIFDQLIQIQLRIPSILLKRGEKAKLTEKIISLYERQISRCINLKDLIGEIELIDFHIFMCNNSDGHYTDCIEHFEKIKAFLEQYYRVGDIS